MASVRRPPFVYYYVAAQNNYGHNYFLYHDVARDDPTKFQLFSLKSYSQFKPEEFHNHRPNHQNYEIHHFHHQLAYIHHYLNFPMDHALLLALELRILHDQSFYYCPLNVYRHHTVLYLVHAVAIVHGLYKYNKEETQ